ncbi:acetyl-CoA carboxylase, biotin carboxyl carrier protein [bacterium]|nr:MAG: acetyl-CoA carboxylase, biotin carboxyl carrier protein [bacterium]
MRIEFIKKLVELLEKSGVNEIEISRFGTRIRISKNGARGVVVQAPPPSPPPPPTPAETKKEEKKVEEKPEKKEEKKERKNLVAIKAPMVGTFYRAPAPDAPPYVEVGDVVKRGQVVCIIEAMKLMNEIESDVDGRIVEILVKNEEPVEYGQELFLVEPI